jgi:hypothetical protein
VTSISSRNPHAISPKILKSPLAPLWIAGAIAAASIAGCSKSPYELAPVEGRVTIDGVPMPIGKVMFAPTAQEGNSNPGKPAFGAIQPDGSFKLSTYDDGDGAVVGVHWVTIYRGDGITPAGSTAKSIPVFDRVTVPQTKTVVAGQDNRVEIQLTSQEIAKFGRRK